MFYALARAQTADTLICPAYDDRTTETRILHFSVRAPKKIEIGRRTKKSEIETSSRIFQILDRDLEISIASGFASGESSNAIRRAHRCLLAFYYRKRSE